MEIEKLKKENQFLPVQQLDQSKMMEHQAQIRLLQIFLTVLSYRLEGPLVTQRHRNRHRRNQVQNYVTKG